jgi:hypothetical protein
MRVVGGRVFDWRPRFDARSLAYRPPTGLQISGRVWPGAPVLDQGRSRGCVGHACAAAAAIAGVLGVDEGYAAGWYEAAKLRDDWPGEADEGTSVLAGLLEGRARGIWPSFRWATSAAELAAGICALGPAVVGARWGPPLIDALPAPGLIPADVRLEAGLGHCVLLPGYLPPWPDCNPVLRGQVKQLGLVEAAQTLGGPGFVLHNSYSAGWGVGGRALLPAQVVERWVAAGGEFGLPEINQEGASDEHHQQ